MTGAGRLHRGRAEAAREPVTVATLLAWRRTGLGSSLAGVIAVGAGLTLVALTGGSAQAVGVVLVLVGGACGVAGSSFLRRVWSDGLVAADPGVPRLRSWAAAPVLGWCAAVLVGFVNRLLPEDLDWMRWLGWVLAGSAVAAYLWLLVLVIRWRPALV